MDILKFGQELTHQENWPPHQPVQEANSSTILPAQKIQKYVKTTRKKIERNCLHGARNFAHNHDETSF